MKRELLIAAVLVASTAGCSGANKSSTEAKVTVGGQVQPVSGPVVCATNQGVFSIAVGDMMSGIIVGLEPDASVVHNAGLPVVNGVVMSFTEGAPGNNATATKNGNAYHITGTATGSDDKNGNRPVSQPFTVDVSCP